MRGDLLASITDGKKLKKVERPAPSGGGGGGGGGNELLDAIRYVAVARFRKFFATFVGVFGGSACEFVSIIELIKSTNRLSRNGAQLKKVERPEAPVAETSNPLFGGNPGINEILAR